MNNQYNKVFSQFYQPIVNIRDGGIDHYEILLRPQENSGQSSLSILQYIMSIEKTKEIEQLDKWNIVELARKMQSPIHAFGFPCSINVSPMTIQSDGFCDFIKGVMSGMNTPDKLHFEITETAEIVDFDKVNEFIEIAREFGSKVAMDDYGSGYSNIDALKRLDVDIIKIDQKYVKDCLRDSGHRQFIIDTVAYAKENNKTVVAEFVEDPSVAALLNRIGVDCGQGYLYGKAEKRPESNQKIQENMNQKSPGLTRPRDTINNDKALGL
ncbi:Cyclic di-GMP phosphodiesterase Gmr [compost metagenome]